MKLRNMTILVTASLLSACVGKVDVIAPTAHGSQTNEKTIDRSKDQVWADLIPALGREFFVVNNMDKSSGFINISYNGDASKYLDCGRIISHVENLRGKRDYDVNAAAPRALYETLRDGDLKSYDRRTELDGRININIVEQQRNKTIVSVNAKYVLTVSTIIWDPAGHRTIDQYKLNFNTGGYDKGAFIECRPNGNLERDILALAR